MTPSDQEKWEETVKPYYKIWTEIDRNFGVAVWSFGLSLVWVLYFSYLKRVVLKSDFFSASVLALSLVACIFIGAVDYVVTDAHRGLLPWWGDTLALPIGSALIMSLVLSPVFVLSAFLVVKQASHQSPKWWNFLLIGVGALPFVLILLVTWDSPSWGVTGAYSVLVFLLLISPARRPKSLGGAT